MSGGGQEDDVLSFVYLVKEPPRADSVSPRGGGVVFEFFYVRAEVGAKAKLGINVLAEFFGYSLLSGAGDGREVPGERVRLEDSILTQRIAPFAAGRRRNRPSGV